MSNQWLRLWHDMPTDPKWRTIARTSGQPISLVQAVYLHLLVSASRNVTRGHADVTLEDIASALDVTEDEVRAVFDAMQGRVLEDFYLSGWETRQPKKEDSGNTSTEAKTPAQRKREQRQRQTESRDVTTSHDESRRVTLDKDKEEDKEDIPPKSPKGDATPGFADFWKTWPDTDRKQAKGKCLEAWKKASAERDAAVILAHVQSLKLSVGWMKNNGEFIPAPLVYINQRRWEGAGSSEPAQQESFV